jgi:hypothetical protein
VIRLARIFLLIVLALMTLSFVMALGTPDTGLVEQVALLALIGGCVYLAAKLSTAADWAVRRFARH